MKYNKTLRLRSVPLFCVIFTLVFSGCSIARNVQSAPAGTKIFKVYVTKGADIDMSGLLPEVVRQIQLIGYPAEIYYGAPPKGAVHTLIVTADWRWDMAVFLSRFKAMLYENGKYIGGVDYSTKNGGANFAKFGHTADKIRPLLTELFRTAQNIEMPKAASMGR